VRCGRGCNEEDDASFEDRSTLLGSVARLSTLLGSVARLSTLLGSVARLSTVGPLPMGDDE
jgi:hypothetical protein